ncbi:MAG: hypothetical protein R2752_07825 [Vicinamibacterales bacterium]
MATKDLDSREATGSFGYLQKHWGTFVFLGLLTLSLALNLLLWLAR